MQYVYTWFVYIRYITAVFSRVLVDILGLTVTCLGRQNNSLRICGMIMGEQKSDS